MPREQGRITAYHEEEGLAEILQRVDGISGHRVCPRAPRQGEEPRLIDHIEVGGDVCLCVFPLKDQEAIAFIKKSKEVSTSLGLNQGELVILYGNSVLTCYGT